MLRLLNNKPEARCVYMAPMEAVAQDRYKDWLAKFGPEGLGKEVVLLTGEPGDLKLLAKGVSPVSRGSLVVQFLMTLHSMRS